MGVATGLLKNQARDQFATVIPLSGELSSPRTGILAMVGNVLRNAFIRAYLPRLQRYGPDTKASCKEKHGYWDYKCRVQGSSGTFSVEVRVDEHKIVDDSGG